MEETVFNKLKDFVMKEMDGVCSAHDFYHIERVFNNAIKIQQKENVGDKIIIGSGALLHEMLDDKFYKDEQLKQQKEKLEIILDNLVGKKQKEEILYIIENIGFGKSLSGKTIQKSIEFCIVEDADRLESIGAIAIARTFAYGGKIKNPIYDPNIEPNLNINNANYSNREGTTINHFYEKLLKLKDLLNTKTAKDIAKNRHEFMEKFLKQFFDEWNSIV